LDRALKVRPEGAVLWFDQARCRAKQGERERALKSLAKAIALDPKLKSAAVAEADLESLRNDPDFLNLVK
jgi:tetratricopeptide (TPR) repeat protein